MKEIIKRKFMYSVMSLFLLITMPQIIFAELPDTLAIIGNKIITLEEFSIRYNEKKNETGISDNLETRKNYLENLISDELLIAKAKKNGVDKTAESQNELRRIKLQELLNSYSEKYISPQIKITDDDLKNLYVNMNTKLDVSHLYAPSIEKANQLYKSVQEGHPFEELALQNFDDPVLRNNGGNLGVITVDEMDPEFEKVAYSLKVGEISKPVKTVRGYSIIKLNGIKKNPLVTESEFLKIKDKLRSLARKRKYESIVKSYSQSLSDNLEIKLDEKFIADLFNSIKDEHNISEIENSVTEKDLDKIVVTSKLGNWELSLIINEMKLTTLKMKQWIRTEENLKDFISGLVTRKYIWMQAINEKLDSSYSYKSNVAFSFDTYLLEKIEENLKGNIPISSNEIEKYYNENIEYFYIEPEVRLSSILLDNQPISDSVKTFLQNGESFNELAKKYSMQKETAVFGGDLGFFKIKDLDELGKELLKLNIGDWVGPYLNEGKYLFLNCTDIKKGEYKSFADCSEEIEQNINSLKWFSLRENYIKELKIEFEVKIFDEKLKKI